MYNKCKELKKKTKGITLVALVVTIIVLLILAGVAISFTIGEEGIFRKAQDASKLYENAQENEMISLEEISNYIDDVNKGNINSGDNEEEINKNVANKPRLKQGMTAIKFNEPTETSKGTVVETNINDSSWYNYDEQKWANARTEDGSMWVWIPRYAYRINEENETVDIVFLQGTSDNYYDEEGILREAKRCKNADDIVDTTEGFTVHPAFTDESMVGYRNGGWDSEIEGIWVAKFEAGYATGGENTATVKASSVNYTQNQVWTPAVENGTNAEGNLSARNWLDGIYGENETAIKYPTFQGSTYSMIYISTGDIYSISRALTEVGNIYGLSSDTDSYMMKNSEWGAIAYLTQSKYGVYDNEIAINNHNENSGGTSTTKEEGNNFASVYAVTGYNDSGKKWNEYLGGQNSPSSTGNIYGIYDLSGGIWERTAGYINNGNTYLSMYGSSYVTGTSDKYAIVYPYSDEGADDIEREKNNYALNTKIYGDAIREISQDGAGSTGWHGDYSNYPQSNHPFFGRGGVFSDSGSAGSVAFTVTNGGCHFRSGFRCVLI